MKEAGDLFPTLRRIVLLAIHLVILTAIGAAIASYLHAPKVASKPIIPWLRSRVDKEKLFVEMPSRDKRLSIIGEEYDAGAPGGGIIVYIRRRASGSMRILYRGKFNERPRMKWLDGSTVEINGRRADVFSSKAWTVWEVEKEKEAFAISYFRDLFKIDKKLFEKYRLDQGIPNYEADPAPKLFVDEKYFFENPRLKKFLNSRNVANPTAPSSISYNGPMGIKVVNPKTKRSGTVIDIKKVEKIIPLEMWEDDGGSFSMQVDSKALLDNGEEVRLRCFFTGYIANESSRLVVDEAIFDSDPTNTPWTAF